TIIFAVNQKHAQFIADRFNENYPQYDGKFARVITHATKYPQSLIDDFSKKDLPEPQIAISVDMLDTGIDVPEVVNLVFFKAVRSKVKFMQMIGRGTR
ncbi:helicase-related protein, partial [Acinetobacter sp. COS3]